VHPPPYDPRMATPRISVFAPAPILTVTIEEEDGQAAIHLHPGGQGLWVAHMASALGADAVLCAPFGGEPGRVVLGLLDGEDLEVRATRCDEPNGAYVHDRRSGERDELAATASPRLSRHEADDLCGAALSEGLTAGVTLLTGSRTPGNVEADLYRRLASDLRGNGSAVGADLTGDPLRAALEGGVDLLKLSQQELIDEGFANDERDAAVHAGMEELRRAGAEVVLLSRAADPALALVEDRLLELSGPRFEPQEMRGTGDSMFAGAGLGLAAGREAIEGLRLGVAAGALNATRSGLGSGVGEDIERILAEVEVRDIESQAG
jgi:1-phosphofructokinase